MAVLGGHVRYVFDSSKEQELFDRADAILLQRHELLSVDAEQNPSGFVSATHASRAATRAHRQMTVLFCERGVIDRFTCRLFWARRDAGV